MAAQMKATADEVAEHRKRYQAKDDAVKQLRRRKMESHDSKLLVQDGADIKVLCYLNKTFSIFCPSLRIFLPIIAHCFCPLLLTLVPIIGCNYDGHIAAHHVAHG